MTERSQIIVADPAWKFKSNSKAKPGRNAMGHYDCMTLDDICALPVKDMAEKDALLFLWVTVPFAELAMRVVNEWGFKYKSQLVWPKQRIGTGFWARNRHEMVYICRRGRFPCSINPPGEPHKSPFDDSVLSGDQREHSRKPDSLQDRIDEVWPNETKLEMFARQTRPGWRVWGNETAKFEVAA